MTTATLAGTTVDVDAEGFLTDPTQWTEELATEIARANGIAELTPRHWQVVNYMLPSPTAAATRFTGAKRTSPHAKMPGTLVSSRYGSRSSVHRPAARTSAPVRTKPRASSATSGGSHAVSASAPMKM